MSILQLLHFTLQCIVWYVDRDGRYGHEEHHGQRADLVAQQAEALATCQSSVCVSIITALLYIYSGVVR